MEKGTQQYAAQLAATLEGRAAALNVRKREYETLMGMLQQLPEQMSHDVMVPVAGCAFFPGSIVHTNEILVLLGENYFAERTASQARQIVQRRLDFIKETMKTVERQLGAFTTRKEVIDEYQREGIVDIQEEYHSDEEKKKKSDAAKQKASIDEAELTRRRNLFVKEVKTEKVERTDEEFEKLEKRLAELEAEEDRVERGGIKADATQESEEEEIEEEEEEGGEDGEDEEGADAFDAFYGENDDESVSDDGEGEEEPPEVEGDDEEEEEEEEDTRGNKQLKPVHLRTKTPPHPSRRPLKPAHVRINTPPVAPKPPPAVIAAVAARTAAEKATVTEATEPIEPRPSKVSFNSQNLPPYVRPPVPPGKLKPCITPPRPITVAAPPPKEVRWTHTSDEDLPRYKNRPPPAPVVQGNRSRSSARGPPLPTPQALQAAAATPAPTPAPAAASPAPVQTNAAVGKVMERAPPAAASDSVPVDSSAASATDAPRKVSRYRTMMEQRH